MGMPKGSKIAENPKSIPLQIRIDKQTENKIHEIMETEDITKSEVIRQGIDLKYQQMEERKNE